METTPLTLAWLMLASPWLALALAGCALLLDFGPGLPDGARRLARGLFRAAILLLVVAAFGALTGPEVATREATLGLLALVAGVVVVLTVPWVHPRPAEEGRVAAAQVTTAVVRRNHRPPPLREEGPASPPPPLADVPWVSASAAGPGEAVTEPGAPLPRPTPATVVVAGPPSAAPPGLPAGTTLQPAPLVRPPPFRPPAIRPVSPEETVMVPRPRPPPPPPEPMTPTRLAGPAETARLLAETRQALQGPSTVKVLRLRKR